MARGSSAANLMRRGSGAGRMWKALEGEGGCAHGLRGPFHRFERKKMSRALLRDVCYGKMLSQSFADTSAPMSIANAIVASVRRG